MTKEGIEKVRALLASYPSEISEKTIEELRALTDEWAGFWALPHGVSVEALGMGGVPAERVVAPGARDDAVLLYLHGGGYTLGSSASTRPLAAALSEATGAAVFVPAYRLAPEHRFPAALEDAVTAFRWLLGEGIPPARIAVGGDSAGGGLAVTTLLALRDEGHPLPAAGICLSPWLDLTCSSGSYRTKAGTDPILTRRNARWLASLYLGEAAPENPLASPLFADLRGLPPLLVQVGSEEVLLDEALAFRRRAEEAGVEVTLEVWDEMIHVWHIFFAMLEEARRAIRGIGAYYRERIVREDIGRPNPREGSLGGAGGSVSP